MTEFQTLLRNGRQPTKGMATTTEDFIFVTIPTTAVTRIGWDLISETGNAILRYTSILPIKAVCCNPMSLIALALLKILVAGVFYKIEPSNWPANRQSWQDVLDQLNEVFRDRTTFPELPEELS